MEWSEIWLRPSCRSSFSSPPLVTPQLLLFFSLLSSSSNSSFSSEFKFICMYKAKHLGRTVDLGCIQGHNSSFCSAQYTKHSAHCTVTQSRAEPCGVRQSHAESCKVNQSNVESRRDTWSHAVTRSCSKSCRVTHNQMKSCKVMRNHQSTPKYIREHLNTFMWCHITSCHIIYHACICSQWFTCSCIKSISLRPL
jgi:hypothetical protein